MFKKIIWEISFYWRNYIVIDFLHRKIRTRMMGYKPWLSEKRIKWLGARFQEAHFGHIVLGKVTFVLSISTFIVAASIKWGFDIDKYILPIILVSFFLIWFMGFLLERIGLRKEFQQSQLNDVEVRVKK